jgi:hypothetical protein
MKPKSIVDRMKELQEDGLVVPAEVAAVVQEEPKPENPAPFGYLKVHTRRIKLYNDGVEGGYNRTSVTWKLDDGWEITPRPRTEEEAAKYITDVQDNDNFVFVDMNGQPCDPPAEPELSVDLSEGDSWGDRRKRGLDGSLAPFNLNERDSRTPSMFNSHAQTGHSFLGFRRNSGVRRVDGREE